MRVVVTGATGLVGRPLVRALVAQGHEVTILSRTEGNAPPGTTRVAWDVMGEPAPAVDGAGAVIHLAGENVAGWRWTAAHKRAIRDSRVLGTRQVVEGIKAARQRPKVLICASGIGFFGNTGDREVDESGPAGTDFLATVSVEWEREAAAVEALGVRRVSMRFGAVLSPAGGALAKLGPLFKLAVGGRLGDGRQYLPWIHLEDAVGLVLHALGDERARGPINTCAPQQVTNAAFTAALARVVRRPAPFPVPDTALRLALGEMADMLLGGQRAVPARATELGYAFIHPELEPALRDLLHAD